MSEGRGRGVGLTVGVSDSGGPGGGGGADRVGRRVSGGGPIERAHSGYPSSLNGPSEAPAAAGPRGRPDGTARQRPSPEPSQQAGQESPAPQCLQHKHGAVGPRRPGISGVSRMCAERRSWGCAGRCNTEAGDGTVWEKRLPFDEVWSAEQCCHHALLCSSRGLLTYSDWYVHMSYFS